MSTPHSLSFPSPTTPVHTKRNSQGIQLPLPSSLNASASQRPHGGTTVNIAGPSSPTFHTRSPSLIPARLPGEPNSPTSTHFPHQPLSSSTHAGGIQPSASFFRPSRPQQHFRDYSRPSSVSSSNGLPDAFQLAPLASHSSDDINPPAPESTEDHDHNSRLQSEQFASLKKMKQSREPLLPMGRRPSRSISQPQGNNPSRVPVIREHSGGSVHAIPLSPARGTNGGLVRSSLDMVLTLSRGLSFDSLRKSTSTRTRTPPPGSVVGRVKLADEEQGQDRAAAIDRYEDAKHRGQDDSPVHSEGDNNMHTLRVLTPGLHGTPSPTPSLDPSFAPPSPSADQQHHGGDGPPLSAVPILSKKHPGRVLRNYELHKSRNRFFLGGRVLTGGDTPWAFIASFGVTLTIAGVWFGTTVVWWWQNEGGGGVAVGVVGAYMAAMVVTSMLATAGTDPGILPRNLDPDPPYPAASPSDGSMRAPMPRDLKVRSDVVRVKYCPTCKTYRPPRTSHCKMCDNCVDGCDHHCQWVNNCVGRRNYTSFFVLLLSATLTLSLIICTAALHLWFLTQRDGGMSFRRALDVGWGSAVVFSMSIAIIWPLGALLSYHMRLLLLNNTTIEQIRNQAHKTLVPGVAPPNPFSHGSWRRNVVAVLCRPAGYSWLDAAGVAVEDRREVNPGLVAGGDDGDGDGDGDLGPEGEEGEGRWGGHE